MVNLLLKIKRTSIKYWNKKNSNLISFYPILTLTKKRIFSFIRFSNFKIHLFSNIAKLDEHTIKNILFSKTIWFKTKKWELKTRFKWSNNYILSK
jgi:hypothetical protein